MITASLPIIQFGSAGQRVAELQYRLNAMLGENARKIPVTGVFNRQTQSTLMSVQLNQNQWARGEGEPAIRNDGLVDAETWEYVTGRTESVVVPRMQARVSGLGRTSLIPQQCDPRDRVCNWLSTSSIAPGVEDRFGDPNTRFYLGLAAGALAIFILWKLEK